MSLEFQSSPTPLQQVNGASAVYHTCCRDIRLPFIGSVAVWNVLEFCSLSLLGTVSSQPSVFFLLYRTESFISFSTGIQNPFRTFDFLFVCRLIGAQCCI